MIALLRGNVEYVGLDSATVSVGGIGWKVLITPTCAQSLHVGTETLFHTSMVVREDSMNLYGFVSSEDRDVFEKLLNVSGIGPRTAVAALSVLSADDLRRAIHDQDVNTLQRIPGIGKKSAQRMVLEIGDKLGLPAHLDGVAATSASDDTAVAEVKAALIQLGWSETIAAKTLESLGGQGLGTADLLRAALLKLGGSRG